MGKYRILKSISVLLFMLTLGASAPHVGLDVELDQFLNARSSASFNKDASNLIRTLPKGTKGVISELKRFESGNYGIKIKLNSSEEVWVHYNPNKPSLKFESPSGEKKPPQAAPEVKDKATTTKAIPARAETPKSASEKTAEDAVAAIEKANKQVTQMVPPTPCEKCSVGIAGHEGNPAPQCNSKNDYIEKEMEALSQDTLLKKVLNDENSGGYKIQDRAQYACIQASMNGVGGDTYVNCSAEKKQRGKVKPCISDNYLRLNGRSFSFVANCLMQNQYISQDELEVIYNMVNVESGFISNAISHTDAGGTGQLTGDIISFINRDNGAQIKRAFQNIPHDSPCSALENDILKNPMPTQGGACSRVGLNQGNPLKNIAYTFIAYRIHKDYMQRYLSRHKAYFSRLSQEDQAKLTNLLAAWSHNAGVGGIQNPLYALIEEEKNNPIQKNKMESFLDKLGDYLANPNYAHPANNSRDRLSETSEYFDKMNSRAAALRKKVGVNKCTL